MTQTTHPTGATGGQFIYCRKACCDGLPKESRHRKARPKPPETIQEHRDEAIRLLSYANSRSPLATDQYATDAMRRARRHVETAELLQRLADLHN